MSKMLNATCSASGQVKVGSDLVPGAEILSEGKKQSSGILLIDGDLVKYLASSAGDLKSLITSMVSILDQLATVLSGLDSATNSPGAQAANITALQSLKTQLDQSKDLLT